MANCGHPGCAQTPLHSAPAGAGHWLDINDAHEQDLDGPQGVIHSVTEPEARGEFVEFSVDFGSAPVAGLRRESQYSRPLTRRRSRSGRAWAESGGLRQHQRLLFGAGFEDANVADG